MNARGRKRRAVVRQALTLLEIGHSVIELRELIASAQPSPARDALQRCVDSIAAWLRTRGEAQLQGALAATLQAGAVVRAAQAASDTLPERDVRLQTALVDLHSIYTSLLDHMAPGAGDHHAA